MFQGAFNRALGVASGAAMAAKGLLSKRGIPDIQKQVEAQKQVISQYEQMQKTLFEKYEGLAEEVRQKREANLASLRKARAQHSANAAERRKAAGK